MRHVSRQKVERWLGLEQAERISYSMEKFSGSRPIMIANMPGRVGVMPGGEFVGYLKGGDFMSLVEYQYDRTQAFIKRAVRKLGRLKYGQLNAGLASLSDLISEATVGNKRREFIWTKAGTTGVVNVTNSLWLTAGQPVAGAAPSNAPGGDVLTDASTGAFPFANPTGGDTQHFVTAFIGSSTSTQTLLMYDRLHQTNKTMSSTATEAVTGVPGRYQNTTAGTVDSAENNFLFVEVRAPLGATAHNWTVVQYTNQAGTTGKNLPSVTGNASAIANRLDHPAGQFFAPLASGDTGIKALTQMQCSASVTGNVTFVIGHPLVFMPIGVANILTLQDGINSGFNLARIFDDAAISFLEVMKSSTTATTYSGYFLTVAG